MLGAGAQAPQVSRSRGTEQTPHAARLAAAFEEGIEAIDPLGFCPANTDGLPPPGKRVHFLMGLMQFDLGWTKQLYSRELSGDSVTHSGWTARPVNLSKTFENINTWCNPLRG